MAKKKKVGIGHKVRPGVPAPLPAGVAGALTGGPVSPKPKAFNPQSVPVGSVAFVSSVTALIVRMGDTAPTPTSGSGGWNETAHPKKDTTTPFGGSPAFKQDLTVMLDRFKSGGSVQREVDLLDNMSKPGPGSLVDDEPPILRVYGRGIWHTSYDYVIESIDWGQPEFASDGTRIRQAAVVHLMRHLEDEDLIILKTKSKKKVNCAKARSKVKRYRVKKGDTFGKIAHAKLGSNACYKQIMKLNKIRDPKRIKKLVGKVIKLP